MNKVEKMLSQKKVEMKQLQPPKEMESRIRQALEQQHLKYRDTKWKLKLAVIVLSILIIGYNFDTLAHYGKKLMGYDQVMNGTLKELNDLGKGQIIGESYTFENGVVITLDGVMLDDNQLLVFYTVNDERGIDSIISLGNSISIKGIFEHQFEASQGIINDEKTEVKYVAEFETPYMFEKKLDFTYGFSEEGKWQKGTISFNLDRSKAMGHSLKKKLDLEINRDNNTFHFDSIVVSPISTVVKGSIQDSFELLKDHLQGERTRPNDLRIKLLANGDEVRWQGSGIGTDMKGIQFEFTFDTLPKDLNNLQIELTSFTADHDVNEQIALVKGKQETSFGILGQKIEVFDVYESEEDTYVTINTEVNTVLTEVYLVMDDESVELLETIEGDNSKIEDGIFHKRTLHFPGTGDELVFDIRRMTYTTEYNEVFDIPIE